MSKYNIKFNKTYDITSYGKKIRYESGKIYEIEGEASRDRWLKRGCELVELKTPPKPAAPKSEKKEEKKEEKPKKTTKASAKSSEKKSEDTKKEQE